MLDLNPDIVRDIIDRARELHAQEGLSANDPTYAELKLAIGGLEPDQQVALVALMWTGRGDFDESAWDEALSEARDRWNPRVADYLLGTPMVADYLLEGLDLLGYGEEAD